MSCLIFLKSVLHQVGTNQAVNYEIVQSIANPDEITLIEKYLNYEAVNAHFNNPDIRAFIDFFLVFN